MPTPLSLPSLSQDLTNLMCSCLQLTIQQKLCHSSACRREPRTISENTLGRFSDTIHMYSSPAVELQLYLLYDLSICVFGTTGRVKVLLEPNPHKSSITLKKALNGHHTPPSSPAGFYAGKFSCDLLVFTWMLHLQCACVVQWFSGALHFLHKKKKKLYMLKTELNPEGPKVSTLN